MKFASTYGFFGMADQMALPLSMSRNRKRYAFAGGRP